MKTFIIAITHNKDSMRSARQAVDSAKHVGYKSPIDIFPAVTPETGWKHILPFENTFDDYPKPENVGACFASHYLLWERCIRLNEPILILEHDAIFRENIPNVDFDMCINFGRPSYIRPKYMVYEEPKDGVQPLVQKNFLGHHAYAIKPEAAKIFVEDCKHRTLSPNDLWMDRDIYPWLQEYRPFPVHADTDFSTVQGVVTHETPVKEEYVYDVVPGSFQHKYLMEYYSHCLLERQSNRFIDADDRDNG